MRRKWIQIGLLTLLILLHLSGIDKAHAAEHKLETLQIHVFINNDGSARITEKRVANLIEGTENYIVIGNLGKSKIKDFVVSENGEKYQYVDHWDIDATRKEKSSKNGIIETKGGYELCWGIGEYGQHEYTVEYTITNFIKQLQDSQILFWRFVNDQTNIPPENVTVFIESENKFTEDTEKIWGFGFPGYTQFQEGKVYSYNTEPLHQNNYVTILVKFKDGMFATKDVIDQPFEEIKEKAFEGSDYGKDVSGESSTMSSTLKNTLIILFIIGFFISRFIKPSKKLINQKPKKFKRKYHGEYYRDNPYEGSFSDIYYVPYIIGASNFERLLTGFILKWINEERIRLETERVGSIFKKDAAAIYFINKDMEEESTLEGELFQMMLAAAGSNNILEQKEFTQWASTNRDKLIDWEKRLIKRSLQKLQDLGYVRLQEKRKFLFKTEDCEVTEAGQELEKNIYKHVNYLHDFSLLNEHEAINVKIWDQIMIWAAFLGLTNVVEKQFKKLYPKYEEETAYSSSSLRATSFFSQNVASARTPSSSNGGGGYSSSGGGGGSFGGGSGGGTR